MTETSPVTLHQPALRHEEAHVHRHARCRTPNSSWSTRTPASWHRSDEPGEIAIRGPQLMDGYFDQPEETANALRDGWMFTGDVARMDEDGYFYIVDRVKDMVIVSGFKVFTRELDEVLTKHPDVEMAASLGVPDPERPGSERVAAAVVLKPGIKGDDAEKEKLRAYLKEKVAPYKVPKVVEFMDQLPTSGVGKILKRELKEDFKDMLK